MEVGRAEIRVDVNDGDAVRDLARVDAAFERTMRKIDGEKAVYEIKGDISDLERKLKEAEAKTKSYDDRIANAENNRSKAQLRNYREQAAAEEKLARDRVNNARDNLKATQRQNEELTKTDKRLQAIERHEQAVARVQASSEKRRAAAQAAEERMNTRLENQRAREATQSERAAQRRQREIDQVPKLEAAYVRLQDKLDRLATARRKAGNDNVAVERINIDERVVVTELERIRRTVRERVGRDPIQLPVRLDPGRNVGLALRHAMIQAGGGPGAWTRAGADLGEQFGNSMVNRFRTVSERGFRNSARNVGRSAATSVGGFLGRTGSKVASGLEGLGDASIRLGPFTTSVQGLIKTLSILGPTILDIAGAAGSLIGVLGAGVAGAATIGAGAITGLGMGFLGLKLSMRNTAAEVTNARSVINAYDKAVQKYGQNSDQAKTAQKAMNNTLAAVSPLARETAKGVESFFANWDRHTAATRRSFGTIAHDGFQALKDITPMWARQTNTLSSTIQKGLSGAFNFLGKGQGRGILDSIMGDFNNSLPSLLHGLGSLGHAFLNFGREGAHALPMLTRGIDSLGNKLLAFTQRDDFGDTVRRWVSYARDLMRFFGAAGRVLMHFFGTGSTAGDRFVRSMTDGLNRWDAFLQSASGHNQISDFFQNAVSGTEALWKALAPIGSAFLTWATNLSPFVTQFLRAAGVVTDFVGQLLKLAGLNSVIGALGATLGALWAVNKISTATRAVVGFTQALLGMGAAQRVAAVAQTEGAAANVAGAAIAGRGAVAARGAGAAVGAAESAAIGAGAARAAGGLTAGAKAAGLFSRALTGVGSAVGYANPYVGAAVLTVGLLTYALAKSSSAADKAKDAFYNADAQAKANSLSYRQNANSIGEVASSHQRAVIGVRQARAALKDTKKGTDDYKLAVLSLRDAQRYAGQTGDALNKTENNITGATQRQTKAAQERLAAFDARTKRVKDAAQQDAELWKGTERSAVAEKQLAAIEARRAPLANAVTAAQNRQAAAAVNIQRGLQGYLPLLGQAEQKLGALARQSKSTAVKVGIKFQDSGDAAKVAANASKTLKSGVPNRIVTKIVADSSNAEQAVRRLQAARLTPKKLQIIENGGKQAVRVLQEIIGRRLAPKEQHIAQQGGPLVLQMLNAILGRKLPGKVQAIAQSGGAQVISAIMSIIGIRIPQKIAQVTANTGGALGAIGSVIGALASIPRTVTTTVVTQHVQRGGGMGGRAQASGGMNPSGGRALIAEGNGPEFRANPRTGEVALYRQPTILNLKPDDYIIPTEPRYRSLGRTLMERFAKDAGIPGFKKGRGRVGSTPNPAERLKPVRRYRDLQDQEDAKNDAITLAQRKVREPETFLTKTGTDSAGNDLYAIDQGKVKTYTAQLASVQALQAQLTQGPKSIMGQLQAAFQPAIKSLMHYRKTHQDHVTRMQHAINKEQKIARQKDKHGSPTKAASAAQRRIQHLQDVISGDRTDVGYANQTMDSLVEDNKAVNRARKPGYDQDLVDTNLVINALGGKVNQALADANPKPEPDTVSYTPAELAIARDTAGLSAATLSGDPNAIAAANMALVSDNQLRLSEGQAMLTDNLKGNDVDAYGIISSATDAIAGLNATLGTLPGSATYQQSQAAAFSAALGDTMTSYGANYAVAGMTGPMFGTGAYGPNQAAFGGPTGKVVQVGEGAIQQNFYELPPAHTISQSIGWELGAL